MRRLARRVGGSAGLLASMLAACWLGALIAESLLLLRLDPGKRSARAKLHFLRSLRARGLAAYPAPQPIRFVHGQFEKDATTWLVGPAGPVLPLGGPARTTVVSCREPETANWQVYLTDEHGFHNPPGSWTVPLDVAATGDSFIVGSCVPSEQNLVALVRERHSPTLNLGAVGNGPLLSLATLREYLPELRPRHVLWGHFAGNDLGDLAAELRHPLLVRYLHEGHRQQLAERQHEVDAALKAFLDAELRLAERHEAPAGLLLETLSLRGLRQRAAGLLGNPAPPPREAVYQELRGVLSAALREVRGWGGQFHFVYLPAWWEVSAEPPLPEAERLSRQEVRRRVLGIASGLGLRIIDIVPVFASSPDPQRLYACFWCHYTPEGYRLAARAVLADLEAASP